MDVIIDPVLAALPYVLASLVVLVFLIAQFARRARVKAYGPGGGRK